MTAVTRTSAPFYMNTSTGNPAGGFLYKVQQVLAKRGGFRFRYILEPDLKSDTQSQWLTNLTSRVDLVAASWFADTTSRRQSGLGFTQGLVDASLVLVTQSTVQGANIWSFTIPFTGALWFAIMCLVVFNTILYYLLDSPDESLLESCYLGFGQFTTATVSHSRYCECRLEIMKKMLRDENIKNHN